MESNSVATPNDPITLADYPHWAQSGVRAAPLLLPQALLWYRMSIYVSLELFCFDF